MGRAVAPGVHLTFRLQHNLAFKQWGNTFPGAACVVALVDRFAQHCHRVEILGESYRDKHRFDPDRPPPSTSKSRGKRS